MPCNIYLSSDEFVTNLKMASVMKVYMKKKKKWRFLILRSIERRCHMWRRMSTMAAPKTFSNKTHPKIPTHIYTKYSNQYSILTKFSKLILINTLIIKSLKFQYNIKFEIYSSKSLICIKMLRKWARDFTLHFFSNSSRVDNSSALSSIASAHNSTVL